MRRHVATLALVIGAGACRPDMNAWRTQLADPAIARLDGAWALELSADSGEFGHEAAPARTVGALAIVLNRERVSTSLFTTPPMAFGTYDIQLDTLGIATDVTAGTPNAWITRRGDSTSIVLSPEAKWPISLIGLWRGDSLVGRWRADQRAGPSAVGKFVLRRR